MPGLPEGPRVRVGHQHAVHPVELLEDDAGAPRDAGQRLVGDVDRHLRRLGDAAVERRAAAAAAAAAAEAEAELQEQQQLHLQQRDGSSGGEGRGGGANGKRPRDRRGERARLKKRKASMVSFDFFLPQQKLVR